ncbi:MAG: FMN-binding glutamate synthase family protein [Deltaproteobacteria bacterium]|nr:FMN-binding glutamate synthase family protein [Deltaproteobacteria bacterium]
MPQIAFLLISAVFFALVGATSMDHPGVLWSLVLLVPLFLLGLWDMVQTRHAILRNFPVIGHGRYILEVIRPEIVQYFIEQNHDGRPLDREQRSVIYQRAKRQLDTLPFGTQRDVYDVGYEWMDHSLEAWHIDAHALPRIRIGGPACTQPYDASLLNISAMSYGSLSKNAVLALNEGAKLGGFFHNTGEGGLSPYHLTPGGDLCWQIGTGYFGCRAADGGFEPSLFAEKMALPQVKLCEIKLSQGAKPGHGGILPAKKVTEEISRIRHVPMGQDVLSPPTHKAFSTPLELCAFIAQCRELAAGKPIGFKLAIGRRHEFLAICKAMLETGVTPDFITVDGGEGGTGAAPLEFSNAVGAPLTDALIFVHNALVGCGLRDRLAIIAAGKITTGFDMVRRLAIGADLCYSARGMMVALGCIQALRCNNNHCPTGVATQDPALIRGLVVEDKAPRVTNFQRETVESLVELLAAAGLSHPDELRPDHVHRRVSPTEVRHYGELYDFLDSDVLVQGAAEGEWKTLWSMAQSSSFAPTHPATGLRKASAAGYRRSSPASASMTA